MLTIFIRHYLFCFLGVSVRYLFMKTKALFVNIKTPRFKELYNYKKYPENEITDAILGFVVLGVILSLIFY